MSKANSKSAKGTGGGIGEVDMVERIKGANSMADRPLSAIERCRVQHGADFEIYYYFIIFYILFYIYSPFLPVMSALSEVSSPAHDAVPPTSIDGQLQQLTHDGHQHQQSSSTGSADSSRKRRFSSISPLRFYLTDRFTVAKAPSVRRACVACHTGKTRCSEVLPCQVPTSLPPLQYSPHRHVSELPKTRARCHLCIS